MGKTSGRLVITGHDPRGRAVIVSDRIEPEIELAGAGVRARFLWGRDDIATFPDDGAVPDQAGGMPPPGGFRYSTLSIAAGATGDYHEFIVRALGDMAEPDVPGFHQTPTLDVIIVLEGELVLELDDGEQRVLGAGDSVVLNGVRHRWHNRGTETAVLAAVVIGARTTRDQRAGA